VAGQFFGFLEILSLVHLTIIVVELMKKASHYKNMEECHLDALCHVYLDYKQAYK
jgi:hypothetical protein